MLLKEILILKNGCKNNTLKSRRKLLNDYDSIAMERIMGKSDLFPISYLQMGINAETLFAVFRFAMIKGVSLVQEQDFWFLKTCC